MGASYLHPWLAFGQWLGTAALAWALTSGARRLEAGLSCLLVLVGVHVVGFCWTPWMTHAMFGYEWVQATLAAGAVLLVCGVPVGMSLAVAAVCVGRRVPVRWWLPPVWAFGEWIRIDIARISISDWLASQWQVDAVVRSVGHLGWWVTFLICVFVAASMGQAIAERRRMTALTALPLALLLLVLPALTPADPAVLNGVAAAHTQSTLVLPHRAPSQSLELVVWPEGAFDMFPRVIENSPGGDPVQPLLPDSDADHVVGMVTDVPMVGRSNQIVSVTAEGKVVESRAKRFLFPVSEERFLGIGTTQFRRGRRAPFLTVGERTIIPLICGEYLSRSLVAQGRALGGELLTISARDWMMPGSIPMRQLLAVQVLRSAEFSVPSVRSSLSGWSTLVDADGRVLGVEKGDRPRFLGWRQDSGVFHADFFGDAVSGTGTEAPKTATPPLIAVLYSTRTPQMRTRCPEGRCSYHALEDFKCPGHVADTVVIAGHSLPPSYLSHPPDVIAAATRCFSPELVVADACYGASSPLLSALADTEALFVGVPALVPMGGFHYGPEFFSDAAPTVRAAAISYPDFTDFTKLSLGDGSLAAGLKRVESMDAEELRLRLVRRKPPQIRLDIPNAGGVIVPVTWDRVSRSRPKTPHQAP